MRERWRLDRLLLSTGDCSNFAFGTIETYFGSIIQENNLTAVEYVLTLEVEEEISIRYQIPTTCNPDLETYRPVFLL